MYADALARPDLWGTPNSGANAMKETFGYLLGIDIHYYAMVDMVGFITIVDAIGGVDIQVTERVFNAEYMFAPGENRGARDRTRIATHGRTHRSGLRPLPGPGQRLRSDEPPALRAPGDRGTDRPGHGAASSRHWFR